MAKKALCIGINNYPGTQSDLTGASFTDDEDKTPPGRGVKGSPKRAKPKAAPKTKAPRGGKRHKK